MTSQGLRIAWFGPAPEPGGGSLGVAAQVLRALISRGHDVHCHVTGGAYELPEEFASATNLTFHYADVHGVLIRALDRVFPLLGFLVRQASRLPAQKRLFRAMLREHRRRPFDLVYAFSQPELPGLNAKTAAMSAPIVFHPGVHAAGEWRFVKEEWRLMLQLEPWHRILAAAATFSVRARAQRRYLAHAARVIAMSERFADLLAEDTGVDRRRMAIVPHPVAMGPADTDAHADWGTRDDAVRVVFVGRVSLRKGIDTLVDLSHRLEKAKDRVQLQVVGNASPFSDYAKLLPRMSTQVTEIFGGIPHAQVAEILDRADLAIQPSKYEPFGLTAAEALAAGLPVVGTDEVGALEGLRPPVAWLSDWRDLDSLERNVLEAAELVRSPARRDAREQARRWARTSFSAEAFDANLDRVLSGVVAEGREVAH